MTDSKPDSISEYRRWLGEERKTPSDAVREKHYETAVKSLVDQTTKSAFWKSLDGKANEFHDLYRAQTRSPLFMERKMPEIRWKPYSSTEVKSFRKNVLENTNWDQPPDGGWVTPDNWISATKDIVRTTLVVKYLDGVQFLAKELEELGRSLDVNIPPADFEAKEEGYYAAHTYVPLEGAIPGLRWDTEKIKYTLEIQITTQFQEVIRPLSHPFYEENRLRIAKPTVKWQWGLGTDEFQVNYLAHTLHHIEGLVVDMRNRVRTRFPSFGIES